MFAIYSQAVIEARVADCRAIAATSAEKQARAKSGRGVESIRRIAKILPAAKTMALIDLASR